MSEEQKEYHGKEKCISNKLSSVDISMGGVDLNDNALTVVIR